MDTVERLLAVACVSWTVFGLRRSKLLISLALPPLRARGGRTLLELLRVRPSGMSHQAFNYFNPGKCLRVGPQLSSSQILIGSPRPERGEVKEWNSPVLGVHF